MFQEEVRRGGEWLDRTKPGWDHRIDVETLDLSNPGKCVLGQLFGSFYIVSAVLGMKYRDLVGLGFMVSQVEGEGLSSPMLVHYHRQYEALTYAWKDYLAERRESEALAEKELVLV